MKTSRNWIALILGIGLLMAAPAIAEDDCDRLWTIGGKGSGEPWLRSNGYRVGMTKTQAHQIRRGGLRDSVAQDTWEFVLPGARVILEFRKGALVVATVILEERDYQAASTDLFEQMGQPDDFGADFLAWRSEECGTLKVVKDDGDNVRMVVQSLDYLEQATPRKRKKKKKG